MSVERRFYSENEAMPLQNPQYFFMNNDNCSYTQQQQQQQLNFMQYQQLQNMQRAYQSVVNNNLCPPLMNGADQRSEMGVSQRLVPEIASDRLAIERMMHLQNEKLRLLLQEQQIRQTQVILKEWESKAQLLFNEKEEQIAEAFNKKLELQTLLQKLEFDNQKWQKASEDYQEHIASLNKDIERVKERAAELANGNADVESCCEVNEREATAEEKIMEEEERKKKFGRCKRCNAWSCSVVLVPCGHLCSCLACRPYIKRCPVCNMVHTESIEVAF